MRLALFISCMFFFATSCEEPAKKGQYVESAPKPVSTKQKAKNEDTKSPNSGISSDLEKGEDPSGGDSGDGSSPAPETTSTPIKTPGAVAESSTNAPNGKPFCKNNGGQGFGSEFDCGSGQTCRKDDGTTYAGSSICVVGKSPEPSGGGGGVSLSCPGNGSCSGGYGWLNEGESDCELGAAGFDIDKGGCSCKC